MKKTAVFLSIIISTSLCSVTYATSAEPVASSEAIADVSEMKEIQVSTKYYFKMDGTPYTQDDLSEPNSDGAVPVLNDGYVSYYMYDQTAQEGIDYLEELVDDFLNGIFDPESQFYVEMCTDCSTNRDKSEITLVVDKDKYDSNVVGYSTCKSLVYALGQDCILLQAYNGIPADEQNINIVVKDNEGHLITNFESLIDSSAEIDETETTQDNDNDNVQIGETDEQIVPSNRTDNETLTSPSNTEGSWTIEKTVDDFGDVTEDSEVYFTTTIEGSFSNTATTDSELKVVVFYSLSEYPSFSFRLLEYGNTPATYIDSSNKRILFKVDEIVYEHYLGGIAPNGDLYLYDLAESSEKLTLEEDQLFDQEKIEIIENSQDLPFDKSGAKQLYKFLSDGDDVRCVIYVDSSKYVFVIPSSNFASILDSNFKELYERAVELMQKNEYEEYKNASDILKQIIGYLDSNELFDECERQITGHDTYEEAVSLYENGDYEEAERLFVSISSYTDAKEYALKCEEQRELKEKYNSAIEEIQYWRVDKAIPILEQTKGYKDTDALLEECEEYKKAIDAFVNGDQSIVIDYVLNKGNYLVPEDYKEILNNLVPYLGEWELINGNNAIFTLIGKKDDSIADNIIISISPELCSDGYLDYNYLTASVKTDDEQALCRLSYKLNNTYKTTIGDYTTQPNKYGKIEFSISENGTLLVSFFEKVSGTNAGNTIYSDTPTSTAEYVKAGNKIESTDVSSSAYEDSETVKTVQEALNSKGYDCGTPDGSKGPKTTSTIQQYQTDNGLEATGEIDDALLSSLGIQ